MLNYESLFTAVASVKSYRGGATDEQLLDKASLAVERGGLGGPTLDFLSDLLWHGFSHCEESAHYERCRLQEIVQLYGL